MTRTRSTTIAIFRKRAGGSGNRVNQLRDLLHIHLHGAAIQHVHGDEFDHRLFPFGCGSGCGGTSDGC
jgi:hypothetical protein